MYLEFLLLIGDYFKTLNRRSVVFEWLLPFVLACFTYYHLGDDVKIFELARKLNDTSITLLGILVGFSITVIAILNTSNSKNIEEIRERETEYKVGGRKISLFQLVLINMTYSVVIEILYLIFSLCIILFWGHFGIYSMKTILCANLFFVLHILFLNIRNITGFYFVLFKNQKKKD